MSNFLAVATVTAAFSNLLQSTLDTDVSGSNVVIARPESTGATALPQLNLFLYQTQFNPAYGQDDLPSRRSDGTLAIRPQAALNLFYLLSFYGDDKKLEPHRMLGSIVRMMHARPILTRDRIRSTITNAPFNTTLSRSNLGEAVETVKFTPISLSLEELSKLWGIFPDTPYTVSVAYEASVVLLEAEDTPTPSLPVRARNLYVLPFRSPVVDSVESNSGPGLPILAGNKILLSGHQLKSGEVRVQIGNTEITPAVADISDNQIGVTLPAGLPAGVLSLQVNQPMQIGTPPTAHRGVESNVAPFVLRPAITGTIVANPVDNGGGIHSADLQVQLNPQVQAGQRVVLLLNPAAGGSLAYRFVAPIPAANTGTITFAVQKVNQGDYFARTQVDGAESVLTVDTNPASPTFHQYIGPKVTL